MPLRPIKPGERFDSLKHIDRRSGKDRRQSELPAAEAAGVNDC